MKIKNVQFINAITVNSDVQMCSDNVHIQPIMPETKTLALEVYNPKSKISKKTIEKDDKLLYNKLKE